MLDLDLDMSKTPTGKPWDEFTDGRLENLDTSFLPVLQHYSSAAQVINITVTFGPRRHIYHCHETAQAELICDVANHLSTFTNLTALDIAFRVSKPERSKGIRQIKSIIYF
jgi:hypothetical protein